MIAKDHSGDEGSVFLEETGPDGSLSEITDPCSMVFSFMCMHGVCNTPSVTHNQQDLKWSKSMYECFTCHPINQNMIYDM